VDDMTDVTVAAITIVIAFCAAFAFALRPRSPKEAALGLLIFATAGVQLAVERGNFDLLIAAMICLAGTLLASTRNRSALFGMAVLSVATMLKLYTGLACVLAGFVARRSWRIGIPASLAALAIAVAVVGPRELLILGQGAPEGGTRFSTGARWLFLHAGAMWGIGAIIVASIVTTLVGLRLHRRPLPALRQWPRRIAVFQIAFLTAVPLFLLKDSYDYRLVLWLPCLALPFAWLRIGATDAAWRRLSITIIALFLVVAGIELPCTWLDAMAKGDAQHWSSALATALAYAKQFAAWLLVGLLSILFSRIVRDRLRPASTGSAADVAAPDLSS